MLDGRLQQVLRSALQYARVRMRILELEIDEERGRLGAMLTRSLVISLAALLAVQLVAVLALTLAWDTRWRLHVLVALIAAVVALIVGCWRSLQRLRRPPAQPLSSVIDDLDRLAAERLQTLEEPGR